jgi:UDP-N-acetylmuramoyl-tripeptide--D-alanyl-D-alanine ligase
VITDSRGAEHNSLFFALKGENFDGNKYAKSALEKGCSYAVIDNLDFAFNDKFIVVNNVLETLQQLGQYHRKQLNIPIIAITGTNGKTTTKELVAAVLAKKYDVSYTQGNFNNHIGVPLTLLEMNKDTEIGVVEMGANHIGEIEKLCEIAEPDFGIITNIGKAHLEGFGSFENIIKAKSELYEYIQAKNGTIFYNSNNSILQDINKKLKTNSIRFGSIDSGVHGEILPADKFLSVKINMGNYNSILNTQLIGAYNRENIEAAASIGFYYGIKPELIISAIESYTPKNNRSQFQITENNKLFLDAYNANPTSVEASVRNFMSLKIENKYIILGDMLELGNESRTEHERIVELLTDLSAEKVLLVGEIYSSLKINQSYLQFQDVNELKVWLSKNKITESNILIKGSRGIKLEKLIELL